MLFIFPVSVKVIPSGMTSIGYFTESNTSAVTLPIKSSSFLCFPRVPITINAGSAFLAYSRIAVSGIPSITSHLKGTSGMDPEFIDSKILFLKSRICVRALSPLFLKRSNNVGFSASIGREPE